MSNVRPHYIRLVAHCVIDISAHFTKKAHKTCGTAISARQREKDARRRKSASTSSRQPANEAADGDRQTPSFHSYLSSSNNQMSLSVGAVATTRRHRPNLHFVTGMSRRCSRPGPFVFPSSSPTHSQVECFEEKNAI